MPRKPAPIPSDPRLDEIARRIRELAREVVGPDGTFDDIESAVLAIRREVLAEMRRSEPAPESPAPAEVAPPKPRTRRR